MGYGDARPHNLLERVFALLMLVALGGMYAFMIGSVCSIITQVVRVVSV